MVSGRGACRRLRTPPVEPPGPGPSGRPRLYPRVKLTAPRPLEMRTLLAQLDRAAWHRRKIKEGSKGPILVELTFVRVTPLRDQLPGPRDWAIFRRTLGAQPETKFYLSNASRRFSSTGNNPYDWDEMACGKRRSKRSKGETRLDHFETRDLAGLAAPHVAILFGPFVSHAPTSPIRKKALPSTTSQTYLLAAEVVENEFKHSPDAPAIIRYHQRRNHAEYRSHPQTHPLSAQTNRLKTSQMHSLVVVLDTASLFFYIKFRQAISPLARGLLA